MLCDMLVECLLVVWTNDSRRRCGSMQRRKGCDSKRAGCGKGPEAGMLWRAEVLCDICISFVVREYCEREREYAWERMGLYRDGQQDWRMTLWRSAIVVYWQGQNNAIVGTVDVVTQVPYSDSTPPS